MASVATGDLTLNDDLDQAEERRRVTRRATSAAAKAFDAAARADDRLVSKLDTARRESRDEAARLSAIADTVALHSVQLAEALIRLRHKRDDLIPLVLAHISYEEGDTIGVPRGIQPAPTPQTRAMQAQAEDDRPVNLTPDLDTVRGPRDMDEE